MMKIERTDFSTAEGWTEPEREVYMSKLSRDLQPYIQVLKKGENWNPNALHVNSDTQDIPRKKTSLGSSAMRALRRLVS